MREIKFRAWDREHSRIIHEKDADFIDMAIRFDGTVWCHDSYFEIHNYNFELIQCTGLKDKNGKEIYEGDILKFEVLPELHVVEATDGGWNPFIDDCQTDGSWHYVIVGNIHENPELLKGTARWKL